MTNQTQNKDINLKFFILPKDNLSILDNLTDEEAGKLFKAIADYQNHKILPQDRLILLLLQPFLNQFSRDEAKYKNICEHRRLAGSKGGKQKLANASNCKQDITNLANTNTNTNTNSNSNSNSNIDLPIIESEVTNNTNTNIVIVENKKENKSKLKEKKSLPIYEDLPHFIDKVLFNSFVEMRIKIKKPMTTKARELVIKDLIKLENSKQGDANLSLENSIKNSWQSVYQPKLNNYSSNTNQGTTTRFLTKQEQIQQAHKDQVDRLLKNRGLK